MAQLSEVLLLVGLLVSWSRAAPSVTAEMVSVSHLPACEGQVRSVFLVSSLLFLFLRRRSTACVSSKCAPTCPSPRWAAA